MLLVVLVAGCDKDSFAEKNSNPSELSKAETRFQVTKVIEQMYNDDYTLWFYNNFDYIYPWSQITTASAGGGNSELMVEMDNAGGHSTYPTFFANVRDIRSRIDALPEEEKSRNLAMKGMTYPISIHTFMTQTDVSGSLVYSEGAMAPYTTPALITPIYDNQELLFNTWLDELNMSISLLMEDDQFDIGSQDLIYNGDYLKWAKFANLLK